MDEQRHKYKVLSYANATSPYSNQFYPQFLIQSIMKGALDDEDFEFNLKVTPMPTPKENFEQGSFLDTYMLLKVAGLGLNALICGFFGAYGWLALGIVVLAWCALNSFIIAKVVSDRVSLRKQFWEAHGLSKFAYWAAQYLHDLIFYLPLSIVVSLLISKFDYNMEYAARVVFFQPFAMLPLIYCL